MLAMQVLTPDGSIEATIALWLLGSSVEPVARLSTCCRKGSGFLGVLDGEGRG